ncbi:MAG TPA: decaprenyl-phosphate phosphoribosyltransferase [Bacteroidota bacterium]|nr:decaprenyl-phosphate phosphoribosyltransferase [Bacteroidota bacterium]
MTSAQSALRLLRPQQWIKNLFLFAPLIFSKHLFEEGYFLLELQAFAVFCLFSSTVYVLNDIADREADKLHPVKRARPIAAGTISIPNALGVAAATCAAGIVLAVPLDPRFQATAGLYVVLNLAYSFRLKQVMLVEVFVIAAGFMLRVLAGAFVLNVVVSDWLVLCTLFVSLFLALSKRRGEILLVHTSTGESGRAVLKEYDVAFIDQMLTITAAGMAISYALYTVAERTVRIFQTENLIFTTVFVLFGIFRYLFLVRRNKTEDNPTLLLVRDVPMLVNIGLWFATCVVIIYYNEVKTWLS